MIFIKTYAEFDPPPMSVPLLPPQERLYEKKKTQDVFCLFPWDFHMGFRFFFIF